MRPRPDVKCVPAAATGNSARAQARAPHAPLPRVARRAAPAAASGARPWRWCQPGKQPPAIQRPPDTSARKSPARSSAARAPARSIKPRPTTNRTACLSIQGEALPPATEYSVKSPTQAIARARKTSSQLTLQKRSVRLGSRRRCLHPVGLRAFEIAMSSRRHPRRSACSGALHAQGRIPDAPTDRRSADRASSAGQSAPPNRRRCRHARRWPPRHSAEPWPARSRRTTHGHAYSRGVCRS